jgi:formylglycine-generating enzyme required for sulfatase activity
MTGLRYTIFFFCFLSMNLTAGIYIKKSSFKETIFATRQSLMQYEKNGAPAFFVSPEVEAAEPLHIKLDIRNKKKLYLRAVAEKGYDQYYDKRNMIPNMRFIWADALLVTPKGSKRLNTQTPDNRCTMTQRITTIGAPEADNDQEVTLGQQANKQNFDNAVVVDYHFQTEISYSLNRNYNSLKLWCGPTLGSAFVCVMDDVMHDMLDQLYDDFPDETENMFGPQFKNLTVLKWFHAANNLSFTYNYTQDLLESINYSSKLKSNLYDLAARFVPPHDREWLDLLIRAQQTGAYQHILENINFVALQRSIAHLQRTFPNAADWSFYQETFQTYEAEKDQLNSDLAAGHQAAFDKVDSLVALRKECLLSNPDINFDELLFVKRLRKNDNINPFGQGPDPYGLPCNYQGLSQINRDVWKNSLETLNIKTGASRTLLHPKNGVYIGLVDLHFSGDKLLYSSLDQKNKFQVFEYDVLNNSNRQISPTGHGDIDNFDSCYLPNGNVIFASTRCFHGVPCVGGGSDVANLCRMDSLGQNIRMLCFDQDDNWHPSMLNNGKIMYTRWEYTDTPHYFTRLVMSMNPDGTNQKAFYGSNSYWPNSLFYAQALPNSATKFIGIISGHHGTRRSGEMVIFDVARGRHEADGAVQKIPGFGKKVEPVIEDRLVDDVWPKFLTPYPISDEYFLVSMQRTPYEHFGLYLVDIFDNIVPMLRDPNFGLLEPIPLRSRQTPPEIEDKVRASADSATVFMSDVSIGPGLDGVPKGTVKSLRLFEWHYAYRKTGGHNNVGIDGPWEPHRILGTVPVYKDGSAHFTVPANTPIAVQPLDKEGKAIQIMRSWFTAMPGERLSCVGCHESQNIIPPARPTIAARTEPSSIKNWYGPARGFSFKREVQPVLDKKCVGCHDGAKEGRPDFSRGKNIVGLRRNDDYKFTPAYVALIPYVRRTGPENDYHLQVPYEYHSDASELVTLLQKGHHNVQLDAEEWDRLITWIDLNVPDHGNWTEHTKSIKPFIKKRMAMRSEFANITINPESLPPIPAPQPFQAPNKITPEKTDYISWGFDEKKAAAKQAENNELVKTIQLDENVSLGLIKIPAGEFVAGTKNGALDERPSDLIKIEKPFYMSQFEVTNEQYAAFNPKHDPGVIAMTNKDMRWRGYTISYPNFPVVRVSYEDAQAFCRWLSEKTRLTVTLPNEEQWEWACRAGSETPFYYGDENDDFSYYANLADKSLQRIARGNSPAWQPRIDKVNDGQMIVTSVGRYQPNAWGLYDMIGNVAEWTASTYDHNGQSGKIVTRGGSWYDRPYRATASYKLPYYPYQKIYNVGFRVIINE